MKSFLLKIGVTVWAIGLVLCGATGATAFELFPKKNSWNYKADPMGEDWRVCGTGMPGDAVQRTKDGAAEWNNADFEFTFGSDACLSGGVYPTKNDVNQVDFGGGLPAFVLAQTTFFFSGKKTTECDMRFNDSVNWFTGAAATPAADEFDWYSVAVHEMGHCLGLDHTDVNTAVMVAALLIGDTRRDLDPDDEAGRDFLYKPVHDLAVVGIKASSQAVSKSAVTRRVTVQIQNRSNHDETVEPADLVDGVATGLVQLGVNVVDDDGEGCQPAAVALSAKGNITKPKLLRSKRKFNVRFDVTYDCTGALPRDRGDATPGDYEHTATVDHSELDGEADEHAVDDDCPRDVTPPFEIDPNPDGSIKDRGCGSKKADKTFGDPVVTDVTG